MVERFADWALWGGPIRWDAWPCGTPSYNGDAAEWPHPLKLGEFDRFTNNGGQQRWWSLGWNVGQFRTLEFVQVMPALATAPITHGDGVLIGGGPLSLGGTVETRVVLRSAEADAWFSVDYPASTGTVQVRDVS